MKRASGFTIVEITVVVMIIGIIITIAFFSFSRIQQDARDNTRRGNATAIAHALEKYYQTNGEYPSVRNLVNNYAGNTGTVVAALLKVTTDTLKMPKMPTSATNALYSGSVANDYIVYTGSSVTNNTACQTSTTGGCEKFTLTYAQETGSNVTINSRH